MAKRPFLYVLPSVDPPDPSLDEVISDIVMDALLDAKTAIPPRSVSGFELELAVRNNLEALVSAYLRERDDREAASAL